MLGERSARHVLAHDERRAVGVLADVVHGDDVRVVAEARHRLGFPGDPDPTVRVEPVRLHDGNRDLAIEPLVDREVDALACAFTEELERPIPAGTDRRRDLGGTRRPRSGALRRAASRSRRRSDCRPRSRADTPDTAPCCPLPLLAPTRTEPERTGSDADGAPTRGWPTSTGALPRARPGVPAASAGSPGPSTLVL